MEIRGLSARGDWAYITDDLGGVSWSLTGTGINADINADFNKMFWGKFRLFYHAGAGSIKDRGRLGSVDYWNIGIATLLGLRADLGNDLRLSFGAGYGMGFGMANISPTDKGDEKWDRDCGGFDDIIENPTSITCFLEGMDGSFSSSKFLAEASLEWGPLFFTPSFELSFNSVKAGQVLAKRLYRIGIGVGVRFE